MTPAQASAAEHLRHLLELFEIQGTVDLEQLELDIEMLQVSTEDSAVLIGHHGETLRALQYIINLLVKQEIGELAHITVDVGAYKKNQIKFLQDLAREAAQTVVETGQPTSLRPMTSYERRIIHVVLSENPDIITESTGEDPNRRIVIKKR